MKHNQVDLSAMLIRGGSWHNVPGMDPSTFIQNALLAMDEAGISGRISLTEAIIGREKNSPTAMGGGLAFPHPLTRGSETPAESFIAVVYPRFPVPWGASDSVPVHAAFFIICDDRHYHLLALSALAKHCSRNEVKSALMDEAPVSELISLMYPH